MAKAKYPCLTEIVREIASDNCISMRPKRQWVWPANADELEAIAAKLTHGQRMVLAAGEYTEQLEIERKYKAKDLNIFCEQVFDGPLGQNFFNEEWVG